MVEENYFFKEPLNPKKECAVCGQLVIRNHWVRHWERQHPHSEPKERVKGEPLVIP